MTDGHHYLLSPDVLVSHLEGEAILLHMGTKNYFRLNRTGAHIWKQLEAGADAAVIIHSVVETFDVSVPVAETAVHALLEDLRDNSLVQSASEGL